MREAALRPAGAVAVGEVAAGHASATTARWSAGGGTHRWHGPFAHVAPRPNVLTAPQPNHLSETAPHPGLLAQHTRPNDSRRIHFTLKHQTSRPQTTPHPPTVSLSRITQRETASERAQLPPQATAHVATCLYVSQTVRGIRGSSGEVCGMAPPTADQHVSQYPPGHPIDGSLPYT